MQAGGPNIVTGSLGLPGEYKGTIPPGRPLALHAVLGYDVLERAGKDLPPNKMIGKLMVDFPFLRT
jgi:hypothetical protein